MRATVKLSGGTAEGRTREKDDLFFPAPVDSQILTIFIVAAKWSSNWSRRVISRRESRPPEPVWRDFTPTGYGTPLAEGKESREIDGRHYVLEYPIKADFALIKAHQADRWGNLVYRKAARNFGPIMATAAKPPSLKSPVW